MESRSKVKIMSKTKSNRKLTDSPLMFSPTKFSSDSNDNFKQFRQSNKDLLAEKLNIPPTANVMSSTKPKTDTAQEAGLPRKMDVEADPEQNFITLSEVLECITLGIVKWDDLKFEKECYEHVLNIKIKDK